MHDLLKTLALAVFVIAVGGQHASAQGSLKAPSFDCKKASTPNEKGICEAFSVSWLDRQLARAWTDAIRRAGSEGEVDLRSSQSAWLAARRGCGSDAGCLRKHYVSRLRELTANSTEFASLSGSFAYQINVNYSGTLSLVHHEDDTMAGNIETVSGPSFHLCNVHFEGAERIGTHYLWTGPRTEADSQGRQCRMLLQPLPGGDVRVDSLHCSQHCGARGRFDALYKKN
ncbi:MAG: hypothetical protein GY948_13705 [Alphaproteobacteria bacterium]|nr:hypothetical protein [Alphaproteobacteria bacterium]